MSNLDNIDLDSEFYEERELRIEDQDLRLLKAIVSDSQAARELSSINTNIFIGDSKYFAEKAINYFKTYKQLPTKRVMLDMVSGDAYSIFSKIWDNIEKIEYKSSEFQYDLEKIKFRYSKFELLKLKENLPDDLNISNEFVQKVIKDVRKSLDSTEKVLKGKDISYIQKTLKEYMPNFRDEFVQKQANPNLGKGILTGYSYLDYITNGLSPSDMLIIGGETGAGKSMLLANMAKQMWMQGNNIEQRNNFEKGTHVLYFSLEMPYDQCARRTLASMSDVSTYALRDAQIHDEEQLKRLADSANFINTYPYEFEIVDIPRGVTVEQIEERFLEAKAKGHRPDVVVVDYLGLMDAPDIDGDDWLRLDKIAGKLHEFARVYNIVLLTAVQLNRVKSKKDPLENIGLHRIGRSSGIMHHATIGIQILTRENEDNYADLEYHVIKNRNGERGSHNIKKKFSTARLIDFDDENGKYIPKESGAIGGFFTGNSIEDISDRLDKLGW